MKIDVHAPFKADLRRKVKKLTLTAETDEEQTRLRNLYLALTGQIRFVYTDPNGKELDEDGVNELAGDVS